MTLDCLQNRGPSAPPRTAAGAAPGNVCGTGEEPSYFDLICIRGQRSRPALPELLDESTDVCGKQQTTDRHIQSLTDMDFGLRTDERGQEAAGLVLTGITDKSHMTSHMTCTKLFGNLSPADVCFHCAQPLQEAVWVT